MTDKTTETKNESKISQNVKDLADIIENGIEGNIETGSCKETTNHYLDYMSTRNVSKETLDNIAEGNSVFVPAGQLAFGRIGTKLMSENKNLNECSISFSGGGLFDSLDVSLDRSRNYPTPNGGEPTIKPAVLTAILNVSSTKPTGDNSKVKKTINELGIKYNLVEAGNKALSE